MKYTYHPLGLLLILMAGYLLSCTGTRSTQETTDPNDVAAGSGSADTTIALALMAEGFTNPVTMVQGPDGRFYMVDQIGQIKISDEQGNLQERPFLDIRSKMVELKEEHDERGLLGLALHPDFEENGRFYVHYSAPLRPEAPTGWSHTKHLSEFRRSADDPLLADPNSERILMHIDQPQTNHNGGSLAFGPDGYLYLSLGDGGGADDMDAGHMADWYERNKGGNGQDQESNLLGSIIRIDVDGGDPYGIPEDNPFPAEDGRRELYATGLRNPYRFAFDRGGDHALFVADVGQKLWEEINIVEAGGNYGWNVMEGFSCFNAGKATEPLDTCPDQTPWGAPLREPVLVFPHEEKAGYVPYGIAVIGGYVYRGSVLNGMDGQYFFAAWTQHHGSPSGAIYRAVKAGEEWQVQQMSISNTESGELGRFLTAFAEDNDGELYLLTTENEAPVGNTGKIYRVLSDSDYDYQVSQKHGHQQNGH